MKMLILLTALFIVSCTEMDSSKQQYNIKAHNNWSVSPIPIGVKLGPGLYMNPF